MQLGHCPVGICDCDLSFASHAGGLVLQGSICGSIHLHLLCWREPSPLLDGLLLGSHSGCFKGSPWPALCW